MPVTISLAFTLLFVIGLAFAHFRQCSVKIVHKVFTLIKFCMLLVIEVWFFCMVNQEVLGKGTPRASWLSLLQEATLLVVNGRTFWIEFAVYDTPPQVLMDS